MKASEAVEILSIIAGSLRAQPDQFNYTIQFTGAQLSGVNITAVGGMGGNTIGANFRTEFRDVDAAVVTARADEALKDELARAAAAVEGICELLNEPVPDRSRLKQALTALGKLAIPAVITATVQAIVVHAIGAAL